MMKHWYKTTIYFCPVCGKEDKVRERTYTKPESIELIERYDWCDSI
jgi:hypothetical protein